MRRIGWFPHRLIAVVVPELGERHWWQYPLHQRRPEQLRAALRRRGDSRVLIIDVPWYLDD